MSEIDLVISHKTALSNDFNSKPNSIVDGLVELPCTMQTNTPSAVSNGEITNIPVSDIRPMSDDAEASNVPTSDDAETSNVQASDDADTSNMQTSDDAETSNLQTSDDAETSNVQTSDDAKTSNVQASDDAETSNVQASDDAETSNVPTSDVQASDDAETSNVPTSDDAETSNVQSEVHHNHCVEAENHFKPVQDVNLGNIKMDQVEFETFCTDQIIRSIVEELIEQVVDLCNVHTGGIEAGGNKNSQPEENGSAEKLLENEVTCANTEKLLTQCFDREMRLCLKSVERSNVLFETSNSLPRLVFDLRQPQLVQVCKLLGSTDDSSGAVTMNSSRVIEIPPTSWSLRRPQTAVRGGKKSNSQAVSQSAFVAGVDHIEFQLNPTSNGKRTWEDAESKEEETIPNTQSIVHRSLRSAGKPFQHVNRVELKEQQNFKKSRKASTDSIDSDEDSMKVQAVNRTYTRNSLSSRTSSLRPASYDKEDLHCRFSSVPEDDKRESRVKDWNAKKHTKLTKDHDSFGFLAEEVSTKSSACHQNKVIKNRTRHGKRIGPHWYSRQFLKSPPSYPCQRDDRIGISLATVKRPNYVHGERNRPLPRHGALLVSRKKFRVKLEESSEFENFGSENLVLWRMSSDDVEELQSQLLREAEHRRVDHAMPVVMQLSQDQIETAYSRVTESMKTYDIVAADSDEELSERDEDDENEDEHFKDILDEYHRMVAEREKLEKQNIPPVETEYVRNRPKRRAVDYGPSSFASILLMEGRRLPTERIHLGLSEKSKSQSNPSTPELHKKKKSSPSIIKSSDCDSDKRTGKEIANGTHSSENKQDTKGLHKTSQDCTSDRSLVKGRNRSSINSVSITSERRSLFEELAEPPFISGDPIACQNSKEELLRSTSVESVGADAPELSAPSSVIGTSPSSPPPDLGLPMMSAGQVSPKH